MASKQEVLDYIKTLGAHKAITREELIAAFDAGSPAPHDAVLTKKVGVTELLYYIGGGIVFLGIAILLSQNWQTFDFFTKLLVTLVAGLGAYVAGIFFGRDKRTETAAPAFYLISALLLPIGLDVVFDNAGLDTTSNGTQLLMSGILLVMYGVSYYVFRKNVFVLFSVLFGTWVFFSLTGWMAESSAYLATWQFSAYRTFIVGVAYMLLGNAFSKTQIVPLTGVLYSFGILSILGAALFLGEWPPHQNVFWELVYPGLVFGALFLSVYLKSKAVLTFSTLFLMIYVLKITAEYFSSGLGWPLSLVIAGLGLIGVGFMSVALRQKYLAK